MSDTRWLYAWGLGSVAFGGASLLVPLYVVELGGGPVALGLLAAAAALVGTPGALLWGRIADRTTRRREVVAFSLLGAAAVLAAIPLADGITAVVAANALLWFVVAAAGPVLTLLVVTGVPESAWNRQIALLNTYQGYGWAGGLVLGAVWTGVAGQFLSPLAAQRSLFAACALAAAVAGVAIARLLPDDGGSVSEADGRRVARVLARTRRNVRGATFPFTPNRLYWATRSIHPQRLAERFTPSLAAYFVAVVFFFTGFAAFFAPLPLFLSEVGHGSNAVFALYLVSSLGSAAFYERAGRLSATRDIRLLQTGGLVVRAGALPAVAVVGAVTAATAVGLAATGAVFAVIGLTWAVIAVTGTTIVSRLAPASLRGEALGVYTALSTAAGGLGSVLGGWLAGRGYAVAFGTAGAFVLSGALLVVTLRGISALSASAAATTDG